MSSVSPMVPEGKVIKLLHDLDGVMAELICVPDVLNYMRASEIASITRQTIYWLSEEKQKEYRLKLDTLWETRPTVAIKKVIDHLNNQ